MTTDYRIVKFPQVKRVTPSLVKPFKLEQIVETINDDLKDIEFSWDP